MSPQPIVASSQSAIDVAKAPLLAYNDKNWDKVKASVTPKFVYDEVGTRRKAEGADEVIALWKGWAQAIPDSKATFQSATASANTVVLEVIWTGTHQGPLQTPKGAIPATGKRIEIRACIVCEVVGDKAKVQRHYFDMGTMLEQLGLTA